MTEKAILGYDCESDVLYIDKLLPYPEQRTQELTEQVTVRLNPITGDVECLEINSFYSRLVNGDLIELPVSFELQTTS